MIGNKELLIQGEGDYQPYRIVKAKRLTEYTTKPVYYVNYFIEITCDKEVPANTGYKIQYKTAKNSDITVCNNLETTTNSNILKPRISGTLGDMANDPQATEVQIAWLKPNGEYGAFGNWVSVST